MKTSTTTVTHTETRLRRQTPTTSPIIAAAATAAATSTAKINNDGNDSDVADNGQRKRESVGRRDGEQREVGGRGEAATTAPRRWLWRGEGGHRWKRRKTTWKDAAATVRSREKFFNRVPKKLDESWRRGEYRLGRGGRFASPKWRGRPLRFRFYMYK